MTSAPSPDRAVRAPRRLGTRGRRWFDIVLVGVLLLGSLWSFGTAASVVGLVLSVLQILPLLLRRSHPVVVLLAVAGFTLLQVPAMDQPVFGQVAVPVSLYSVARFAPTLTAAGGLVIGLLGAVIAAWDWRVRSVGVSVPPDVVGDIVSATVPLTAIVVASWALGTLGRTRRAYVDGLVERADRIERQAAQQVALAASDERARIAREMHDVVAHALSVVVVQADGAQYAAAHDPDVATATLGRIAATGRSALADMRQLLGLLRADETGTRPLPGLADLPELLQETGATSDLRGLDRPVSAAVALTTYRVVQEALTNVRKHAGPGACAHVVVEVSSRAIEVAVTDDGRGAAADPAPTGDPGHGLIGMRERVGLHGGVLRHAPQPGGGYEVAARIPL